MLKKSILFIVILFLMSRGAYAFYDESTEKEIYDFELLETVATNEKLVLNCKNAILYDNTYDEILYEKNAYEKVPNASTTKVLTAIVAYENGKLEEIVTVGKNAALIGGSGINLKSGDKITVDDLIKGLLVHSGNDAAVAIAENIAGSVENFCQMMNKKAKEMGLKNTNFVTPHGLDKQNHYSTAYDLAKMSEYLLNIEYLAEIVKQSSVTIKVNGSNRVIGTTNEMLSFYEGTDGVKTGFTGNAGRCLITSCTRNGRQLISVVLGCGTKKQRTEDSVKLLNYGFSNYEIVNICKEMQREFSIEIEKGRNINYLIKLEGDILLPIKNEKKDKITYKYEINSELKAPILIGENIGKIYIYIDNELKRIIDIKMPQTVEKKRTLDYFKEFLKFEVNNYEICL